MKLRQIILIAVVLAVAGVTLSCVWLAQAEYRFSNRPEVSFDLRVRWLSLVVALFFVIAGLGGVVGLWQFVMNKWVHHRQFTQWEDLETKLLAGVCALGAAALDLLRPGDLPGPRRRRPAGPAGSGRTGTGRRQGADDARRPLHSFRRQGHNRI